MTKRANKSKSNSTKADNSKLDLSKIKIITGIPISTKGNPDRIKAVEQLAELIKPLKDDESIYCPARGENEANSITTTLRRIFKKNYSLRTTFERNGLNKVTGFKIWKGQIH